MLYTGPERFKRDRLDAPARYPFRRLAACVSRPFAYLPPTTGSTVREVLLAMAADPTPPLRPYLSSPGVYRRYTNRQQTLHTNPRTTLSNASRSFT